MRNLQTPVVQSLAQIRTGVNTFLHIPSQCPSEIAGGQSARGRIAGFCVPEKEENRQRGRRIRVEIENVGVQRTKEERLNGYVLSNPVFWAVLKHLAITNARVCHRKRL